MFNNLTISLMYVRFRFKSAAAAEEAAGKLPVGCKWTILRDCTHDAYLEVSEDYEDYVEKYLYEPYREQEGGNDEQHSE